MRPMAGTDEGRGFKNVFVMESSGWRSDVGSAAYALHGIRPNLWLSRSPEQWDCGRDSRYTLRSRTAWVTSNDQPGRRQNLVG